MVSDGAVKKRPRAGPCRFTPRHTHKSLMPFREMRRAIEVWLTAVLSAADEGLVGPIVPVAVTWARCEDSADFHQAQEGSTGKTRNQDSRPGRPSEPRRQQGRKRTCRRSETRVSACPISTHDCTSLQHDQNLQAHLLSAWFGYEECREIEIGEKKHGQPEITTGKTRGLGGAAAAQRQPSPSAER
jgi:hypothetical protein